MAAEEDVELAEVEFAVDGNDSEDEIARVPRNARSFQLLRQLPSPSASLSGANDPPLVVRRPGVLGWKAATMMMTVLAVSLFVGVLVDMVANRELRNKLEEAREKLGAATGQEVLPPVNMRMIQGLREFNNFSGQEFELELDPEHPLVKQISGVPVYMLNASLGHDYNVVFFNQLQEEPSIVHAHGMKPPNAVDGVPWISAPPINPREAARVQFSISGIPEHFGTFWAHSHMLFQTGKGMLAPVVVQAPLPDSYPVNLAREIDLAQEAMMLLEDFCPQFISGLDPPYKLDPVCNHSDVFAKLEASAMDMMNGGGGSHHHMPMKFDQDLLFASYLTNRRNILDHPKVELDFNRPIRLRVVNAAGSTNFRLNLTANCFIIAVDGHLVKPLYRQAGSPIWLGGAQRVDLFFRSSTMRSSISVIATPELLSEYIYSTYNLPVLLSGMVLYDPNRISPQDPSLDLPTTIVKDMKRDCNKLMDWELEKLLSPGDPRLIPDPENKNPVRKELYVISGHHGFHAMNGSAYMMNGPNPHPVKVKYGETVYITLENRSSHSHPMVRSNSTCFRDISFL